MQEIILTHIKEKYQPDVVILHGSRALGKAREHSDWDFIFLYNEESRKVANGRELYQGQNIEFTAVTAPVDDIIETFNTKLQSARVLFDTNDQGARLLEQANEIYSQGISWSDQKIADHKLWVQGRIDGMRDNFDSPELFYKYFSDFYQRVFNYWYWITKKQYSQPIYIALKEMAGDDKDLAELIGRLVEAETSLEEKVNISEKIRDHIFESK
jgi:hypothetical protein